MTSGKASRRRRADESQPGPVLDPKFIAGVTLLQRTGALDFQCGYTPEPRVPVWYAVCGWRRPGGVVHEAAGGLDPVTAVMRLCEQVIDGGVCQHCDRRTIFDAGPGLGWDGLESLGCVYAWDPELKVFRRGCEGDA